MTVEVLLGHQPVPWNSLSLFSFLLTFGFLRLFLVCSYCHICSGDVCSSWISCLPENEHKTHCFTCPLFNFTPSRLISWWKSYLWFSVLSVAFLEKPSLSWQHWWWGPGLAWPGGSVLWACGDQSVTRCTREQELMPVLLKAVALSCVFIDLFPLFMVDDLQEHREEAALQ